MVRVRDGCVDGPAWFDWTNRPDRWDWELNSCSTSYRICAPKMFELGSCISVHTKVILQCLFTHTICICLCVSLYSHCMSVFESSSLHFIFQDTFLGQRSFPQHPENAAVTSHWLSEGGKNPLQPTGPSTIYWQEVTGQRFPFLLNTGSTHYSLDRRHCFYSSTLKHKSQLNPRVKNNCDCPALTRAHTPTRTQNYVTILQTKLDPVSAGQRNLYQPTVIQTVCSYTDMRTVKTNTLNSVLLRCLSLRQETCPYVVFMTVKLCLRSPSFPQRRGKQPYRWPKIYYIRILENEWNRALLFMVLTHTAPWQFLCLVARVWTQIASWKIHQPTLDLVYSKKIK